MDDSIKRRNAVRRDGQERAHAARKQLVNDIDAASNAIATAVRYRISTIHTNSTSIASQTQTLSTHSARLTKSVKQWQDLADGARGQLKEVGDLENWAEVLEREVKILEEAVGMVRGRRA
ncbi:ATP-binding mismatch repair protein [Saitoella coloradoensis]